MLGGRFGYFLFFSARGGEGGVRGDREAGGRFFENPRGGGVYQEGVGGGREGVCRECGGGGLNILFSGPTCPPSMGVQNLVVKGNALGKIHLAMTLLMVPFLNDEGDCDGGRHAPNHRN